MKNISKDDYLLRNISKIKHKKWELYIITRILHSLNDQDIEYTCQQFVKTKSGRRYLADICFPTLKLYYEIDELQHSKEKHKLEDSERKKEIIDATGFVEKRIKIYNLLKKNRKLKDINYEVDKFVKYIKKRKKYFILKNNFTPWDYRKKYSPKLYIKKGYIDINENVGFLTQRDAKRCFGYTGGHVQRAVWKIPNSAISLWFPKLYKNRDWDNILSDDLKKITMQKTTKEFLGKATRWRVIVFAHNKNLFGQTLYKFLGLFELSEKYSNLYKHIFVRVKSKIILKNYLS